MSAATEADGADAGHQGDHFSPAVDNAAKPFRQGLLTPVAVDEQKLCVGVGLAQGLGVYLVAVTEVVDQFGLCACWASRGRPVDEASHFVSAEMPPSATPSTTCSNSELTILPVASRWVQ